MEGLSSGVGLAFSVGIGLALAFLSPYAIRRFGPSAFAFLALYPLANFIFFCLTSEATWEQAWVPALGVDLALKLDGLSRMFALLINGLGAAILLYSSAYFKPKPNLARFSGAFIAFLAAMLGLVLSDDAIGLFIFWELTSITSFLLIGFYHKDPESRTSAQQALLLTGAGGLAMMAGLILLRLETGTFRFSEMTALSPDSRFAVPAFLLVLAGAVTKSAQFPFHFWLPNAMAGPTPVSAFLHSATMVKAGIFLLARTRGIFEGLPLWTPLLTFFGGMTVLTALVLMYWNRDIKKLLAYSTLGALGMLTFLIGQPGEYALKAFVSLLVAHALYKGALFLIAGSIDHSTGTRDTFALSGLRRAMPYTALAAGLAAGSSFGLVEFLGFQGKEYAIMAANSPLTWIVTILFALGAGLAATRITIQAFFVGKSTHSDAHEAPLAMLVGPIALGFAGLIGGIAAPTFGKQLLTPMGSAIAGEALSWKWVSFPGFNTEFFIGLVLIVSGLAVGFRFRTASWTPTLGLDALWRRGIDALPAASAIPSRWVQSGRLRSYLALFFVTITLAALLPLVFANELRIPIRNDAPRLHEIGIALVAVCAAVAAIFSPGRLSAICMLGIVGTGIAVLYLGFGAPDLAMTQVLTELLTIVIAVLVFHRLPKFRGLSNGWTRARDATIAIAFGVTMTLVVLSLQSVTPTPDVAQYYAENAVPMAYGRNVVNTILVDFRAMDTIGEVFVLALAGLGVYALLHVRAPKETEA